jgi:SAM-dependent methyltransferase
VDTPYVDTLMVDVCPAWLSMIGVLHGQPPLDVSGPLTWVDLGCGSGLSTAMVAAAHPAMTVWGCDFNPAHIERARSVATRVRLDNCTFAEASFAEVADDPTLGPPEADIIVVNGVYSWVSPEHQRQIIEIIRRRLRPGGVAYVMYEVSPGWASMVPIAEAMRLLADADDRRAEMVVPEAVTAAVRLVDATTGRAPFGQHEQRQLDELPKADPRYVAHEFLGGHFAPLVFEDVARSMRDAKCSYLGSVAATDHLAAYWSPPELHALLTGTHDLVQREMMRDLVTQRALRRDLFRRGLASPTSLQREAWLDALTVVGLGKAWDVDATAVVPVGEVGLADAFYAPLVEALERGSLSRAQIREIHPETTPADAATALCLLVTAGYAAPVRAGWDVDGARQRVRMLNEMLIGENRAGGRHEALVAPATGAAVSVDLVAGLALGAVWDGESADASALADLAVAELARQGRVVREAGAAVEGVDQARQIAARRIAHALDQIAGAWTRLGIS